MNGSNKAKQSPGLMVCIIAGILFAVYAFDGLFSPAKAIVEDLAYGGTLWAGVKGGSGVAIGYVVYEIYRRFFRDPDKE